MEAELGAEVHQARRGLGAVGEEHDLESDLRSWLAAGGLGVALAEQVAEVIHDLGRRRVPVAGDVVDVALHVIDLVVLVVGASRREVRRRLLPGELFEGDVDAPDGALEDLLDHALGQEVRVGREPDLGLGEALVDSVHEPEEVVVHQRLAPAGERDRMRWVLLEAVEHDLEGLALHVHLGHLEQDQARAHVAVEVAAIGDLELNLTRRAGANAQRQAGELGALTRDLGIEGLEPTWRECRPQRELLVGVVSRSTPSAQRIPINSDQNNADFMGEGDNAVRQKGLERV